MAHLQQMDFCLSVKRRFPMYFSQTLVLDIGALDLNGNNQYLFEQSGYCGVDLLPGKNVDWISPGHELALPNESFDVIISTECFEHDPHHQKTLLNSLRMLKPGGLFLFSCATTGRPEHGTRRTTPEDAPFLASLGAWGDYYQNLTEHDVRTIIDMPTMFSQFEFSTHDEVHDLYFWGIKKGTFIKRTDYSFLINKSSSSTSSAQYAEDQAKLAALYAELKGRDQFIQAILQSKSWRWTAWLRKLLSYKNNIKL